MKYEFNIPQSLNGKQLIEELSTVNVAIEGLPHIEEGKMYLDIISGNKSDADLIVNSHVGIDKEPTVADKLAAAGLTIDELKSALGLS